MLRVSGREGVVVDNSDVEASTRRGIVVMNTPGANAVAVAGLTVLVIIDFDRFARFRVEWHVVSPIQTYAHGEERAGEGNGAAESGLPSSGQIALRRSKVDRAAVDLALAASTEAHARHPKVCSGGGRIRTGDFLVMNQVG